MNKIWIDDSKSIQIATYLERISFFHVLFASFSLRRSEYFDIEPPQRFECRMQFELDRFGVTASPEKTNNAESYYAEFANNGRESVSFQMLPN